MNTTSETPTLLDSALTYAARGWPVFPLEPRGKNPLGSLAPHGFQDATTDAATIRRWWASAPDANIGLATGAASGLLVVDVDHHHGTDGEESLRELEQQHGALPLTVEALTGGGGRHVFFRCPNGQGCGKLAEGIDLKANGGYVVAAPSVHPSGAPYEWEVSHHPDDVPLADPPAWLVRAAPRATSKLAATGVLREGGRNTALTSLAGSMRRRGATQDAIEAALLAENAARCDPPLPEAEVLCIAASVARYAPAPGYNSTLLRINAGERDLAKLSDTCWAAILAGNTPPRLFLHGEELVRLEDAEDGPALRRLSVSGLRYEAARCAQWYTRRLVGGATWQEADAAPSKDMIEDMLSYPPERVHLPPVERIAQTPVFSPDGRLLATRGYHAEGRVLVYPPEGIPAVPERPDGAAVAAAVALIDEMIADFPFCNGADRAHAFAMMLLPFVRDMIDGPTPLHLIEAPTPGTGKGLLAATLLMPALGDGVAATTQGRDEDEWRKRLTTCLREGKGAVLIDNITTALDSGTLSAALTAWPLWSDRLLGTLEGLSLPIRCVWAATGNNPTLSTEVARRCVRIRLDAKQDRPFQREPEVFRHADLRTWAREQRPELIAAALTLAQAWLAAGRPRPSVRPLGSYESWSRVIGGILEHAGVRGFLGNLDELYERADTEGAVWRRFVAAWWEAHQDKPVGVSDLYQIAEPMDDFDLGKGKDERSQKTRLGMGLARRRDMVLGDYRIECAGTEKRTKLWRLTPTRGHVVYLGVPSVPFHSPSRRDSVSVNECEKVHQGTPGTPDPQPVARIEKKRVAVDKNRLQELLDSGVPYADAIDLAAIEEPAEAESQTAPHLEEEAEREVFYV